MKPGALKRSGPAKQALTLALGASKTRYGREVRRRWGREWAH